MTVMWVVCAGLVASALAAALFSAARSYGLTTFSPAVHLGCLVADDHRLPMTETLGLFIHFLLGSTVVPAAYAVALPGLGGPGWVSGGAMGLLHGGAVIATLPWLARVNRCVLAGRIPPPGRFGQGWGRNTAVVVMCAGVLYGAVVGAILGAAVRQSDAILAQSSLTRHFLVATAVQRPLHDRVGSWNQMFSRGETTAVRAMGSRAY
jgi:hypothetical protein